MNPVERQMLDLLKDLKDNHHVLAVKAEFEAEGSRVEELIKLSEIVFRADMELFVKIGGCEAISDLQQCRILGASGIMAPMIETPFAMSKFINAINKVYTRAEQKDTEFIINVETITCYANIDSILGVEGFEAVDTIIVGRQDLSRSMGLSADDIDGEAIFKLTEGFLRKAEEKGIVGGVGGGISMKALPFLHRLGGALNRFETRKVVFKTPEALERIELGLLKAMEFETLYLKNKRDYYNRMAAEDTARIDMMTNRVREMRDAIECQKH